jgi:hypothetical protein
MNKNRKEHNNQENQSIITEYSPAVYSSVVSVDNQIVKSDWNSELTSGEQKRIMTIEEISQYLRKSPSWVYRHVEELGGRKLGGSLFFPSKEDLYDSLFYGRERMAVRIRTQESSIHQSRVREEKRGKSSRGGKTKGGEKPCCGADDPNRYGLLDIGK